MISKRQCAVTMDEISFCPAFEPINLSDPHENDSQKNTAVLMRPHKGHPTFLQDPCSNQKQEYSLPAHR